MCSLCVALVRRLKEGGVVILQGCWELEGACMLDHCPWQEPGGHPLWLVGLRRHA